MWVSMVHIGSIAIERRLRERLMATAVRLFVSDASIFGGGLQARGRGASHDARDRPKPPSSGGASQSAWSWAAHTEFEGRVSAALAAADATCDEQEGRPWIDATSIEELLERYAAFHTRSLRCCSSVGAWSWLGFGLHTPLA